MSPFQDRPRAPVTCLARRSIIAALAAVPILAVAATPSMHRPAMWMARKGRATVHLFGQMPLRESTRWSTSYIEDAFGQSDILWLENPEYDKSSPEILEGVRDLARRNAVEASYSIFDTLDPESAARLDRVANEEGLSRTSLVGKGPTEIRQWLAEVADRRTGVTYTAIPERNFRTRALDLGKDVRTEWRDLLEVVTWGTEAPPDLQLDVVRLALDDVARADGYEAEVASWLDGTLGPQLEVAQIISRNYPRLYRRMSSERNAALAARIVRLMAGSTRQFACIGILHLLGPDSVQACFRKAGIRVVRVEA